MAANGAPISTNNPKTASASTTWSVSNANGSNCTTSNRLSPAAAKKSPAGTITGGAGRVDAVSPLKPSYINKVKGQHKRSASLPEHILDNVSLPLSKLELEKVANAIGGTERVAATSSDKSAIAAEDTVGNFNDSEVAHMRDSTPSVGGSCLGPPSSGGVTSAKGGGRSGHYPKLSWDSNNGGAESGTDWMENGSNDYSNLEVVSTDSKIGRLFSKHFPDLCEVPIKHANYSCSLIKDSIPYHGRLYLTPSWICFYSKLFKKQLTISLREVLLIKKEKSAFVVPNAIKVVSSTQKLVFGSLFHRHVTFKLMTVLWSRNCCDRALIDYDQISLDSTAGTGTTSAILNETEEGEREIGECSGIIGDQSNMRHSLCVVGSKNAIFSPHAIQQKQSFEVVSCAEEMLSADDERTLFFNSPTDPADLVLKSSSSKSPCSDHDQHDSQDRCTTVVRVNAPPVQSSLSRSGDNVNDNLATLTSASAVGIEQMSQPYQLTATVRYRPLTTSRAEQRLQQLSSNSNRGAAPADPHSSLAIAKAIQQPESNRFTLSSDSGSPQTETRMVRRSNENHHHHHHGMAMCNKGSEKGGSVSSSGRGSAVTGGGRSARNDHSMDQKKILPPKRLNTVVEGAPHQENFCASFASASNSNKAVEQKDVHDFAVDFVPLCPHCQSRRSESAKEGVCLLLFTVVLFLLLMTSLVLIWQLRHLQSLPHFQSSLLTHHLTNHHSEHHGYDYHSRGNGASASQKDQPGSSSEEEDTDELTKISSSSSLVQFVLHSCAMKQATSEYLAKTIEANNLLLNNINSQLEKVANSFGVDQLALEKLVKLMKELKEATAANKNHKSSSPGIFQPPTAHALNGSNS